MSDAPPLSQEAFAQLFEINGRQIELAKSATAQMQATEARIEALEQLLTAKSLAGGFAKMAIDVTAEIRVPIDTVLRQAHEIIARNAALAAQNDELRSTLEAARTLQ